MLSSGQLLLEGAWGLNTLTSQRVLSCLPPQKPFTAMSSRAPSWVLVEFKLKVSVDKGCRSGSVLTSWHTSVSKLAVRSLISCHRIGKPPLGQVKAWSIVNLVPHSQFEGVRLKGQPYLRAIASRNAPLCSLNPKSAIGKVVSQLEAPLSEASSIDLFNTSGKSLFSLSMACVACCRLRLWISALADICEDTWS